MQYPVKSLGADPKTDRNAVDFRPWESCPVLLGVLVLAALLAFPASLAFGKGIPAGKLAECNVVWTSPSENSRGSMPLGNGCVGVNAWVEPDGKLVFLLSKTDAWSENCRLSKLGRVRVALEPNPLEADGPMEQQLRLQEGEMTVRFGEGPGATRLRVWVDANRPVVHVEADWAEPSQLEASLELWRTSERELEGDEVHSAYGLHGGPEKIVCSPDTVVEGRPDRVLWYHRNTKSIWADNLRHQGLEALIGQLEDPLMHRTFGGLIEGAGLRNTDARTLRSVRPRKRFALAGSKRLTFRPKFVRTMSRYSSKVRCTNNWFFPKKVNISVGQNPFAAFLSSPRVVASVASGEWTAGRADAGVPVKGPGPVNRFG